MLNQLLNIPTLLLIALTLVAFYVASFLNKRMAGHLLFHPLPISVVIVIGGLWCYQIPYSDYLASNQLFQWLIGPAVVSLAIPLYQNLQVIRQWLSGILLAIALSMLTGGLLLWGTAAFFEVSQSTQIALSTKSVTTPIALSINELLHGQKTLAATLVMMAGLSGAIIGPILFSVMKIQDERIKGIALGLTSHAIGTQKAFEISPVCGAFAALTMTLAGIIYAIVLPLLDHLFVL